MKATGIVRKVDQLGRIVLPKELRDTLDIKTQAPLEIYVNDECIILKKYAPACIICGGADELIEFRGKRICRKCISNMNV